jgi:hypothetical protein
MRIEGLLPSRAEAWIEEWLAFSAGVDETPTYWQAAWEWIVAQANGGRRPGDGKEPVKS